MCTAPCFTADGRTVITLGVTYEAPSRQYRWFFELWDLTAASERPLRIFGKFGRPQEFQISPDGKALAVIADREVKDRGTAGTSAIPGASMGAEEHELRILDLATGRDLTVVRVEGVLFRSVAFSPDSQHLAAALADGTVRIFNTNTGRERLPRAGRAVSAGPAPERGGAGSGAGLEVIDRLAFAPDGSILAGGSSQAARTPSPGALYLWDFASGRELLRIGGFRVGPASLSFAPDGKTIATAGSWEPIPRIWDVATGREAFAQPGHVMGISTLAVSPADGTIFTGSHDGTVRQLGPEHRARTEGGCPVQFRPDSGRRSRRQDPHRGRPVRRPGALECAGAPRDPSLRRPPGRDRPPVRVLPGRPDRGLRPEDLGRRLGPAPQSAARPGRAGRVRTTLYNVLYLRREAAHHGRARGRPHLGSRDGSGGSSGPSE